LVAPQSHWWFVDSKGVTTGVNGTSRAGAGGEDRRRGFQSIRVRVSAEQTWRPEHLPPSRAELFPPSKKNKSDAGGKKGIPPYRRQTHLAVGFSLLVDDSHWRIGHNSFDLIDSRTLSTGYFEVCVPFWLV